MRHGVSEIDMNDGCFHVQSTVARRNADVMQCTIAPVEKLGPRTR